MSERDDPAEDPDRLPDDASRPTWLEGVESAGQGERHPGTDEEGGRAPGTESGGSEQPPPDPEDLTEPPHLERGSPHEDEPAPADEPPPPAPDDDTAPPAA